MVRRDKFPSAGANSRKVDTSANRTPPPLNSGAFNALDALNTSDLAPGPVEQQAPPKPEPVLSIPKRIHAVPPNSKGRVVLRRETKHRAGKAVIIVSGFRELPGFSAVDVLDLAKLLRGRLGCGGSADRNEILLQGDRPADVAFLLREQGFRVEGVME